MAHQEDNMKGEVATTIKGETPKIEENTPGGEADKT
jgi:hypothetical protein